MPDGYETVSKILLALSGHPMITHDGGLAAADDHPAGLASWTVT